ncbi:DUF6894 family protein [Microvirga aerophila]|uniref:DUF6894 domain-containing protein n=1 Tax=Microvirga aerophila TaxID=670291 RepID=A0A512C3Q4_9HYPH|nr:hypothetical protein MAE02_65340 [Microvirga aerophila]
MPLFYFDLRQRNGICLHDEIGTDLPDIEAARQEAVRTIASFQRDAGFGGPDYTDHVFEVFDEHGRQVFTLALPGAGPPSFSSKRP